MQTLVPIADIGPAVWSITGGASEFAVLADSLDGTYISCTPGISTYDNFKVRMTAVGSLQAGTSVIGFRGGGAGGSVYFKIYQNGILLETTPVQVLGAKIAAFTYNCLSTFTDGSLIEIEGFADSGAFFIAHTLTKLWFDVPDAPVPPPTPPSSTDHQTSCRRRNKRR